MSTQPKPDRTIEEARLEAMVDMMSPDFGVAARGYAMLRLLERPPWPCGFVVVTS